MKKTILILLTLSLGIFSCNEDDSSGITVSCERQTTIDAALYASAPDDGLTINSLEMQGNCLNINFTSGGCDGSTWQLQLIDAESVQESNPPERTLRLSLSNEEPCFALITKELAFDVSRLRVNGNQVILNMANTDLSVLYRY